MSKNIYFNFFSDKEETERDIYYYLDQKIWSELPPDTKWYKIELNLPSENNTNMEL